MNIVPVPKSGDLSSTNNYRGISLICIIAKIYNRMILNRIRSVIDLKLQIYHNGFRPGRTTVEAAEARTSPAPDTALSTNLIGLTVNNGSIPIDIPENSQDKIRITFIHKDPSVSSHDVTVKLLSPAAPSAGCCWMTRGLGPACGGARTPPPGPARAARWSRPRRATR